MGFQQITRKKRLSGALKQQTKRKSTHCERGSLVIYLEPTAEMKPAASVEKRPAQLLGQLAVAAPPSDWPLIAF